MNASLPADVRPTDVPTYSRAEASHQPTEYAITLANPYFPNGATSFHVAHGARAAVAVARHYSGDPRAVALRVRMNHHGHWLDVTLLDGEAF